MPKYAAFFKAKGKTLNAMMDRPTDRAAALRKLIEAAGGKLESYYWMFGHYDGFAIAEMPDSSRAAALAIAIGSTGSFTVETHELVAPSDLNEIVARAKDLRGHYQAPGD